MNNKKEVWYVKLLKLLKLETTTPSGRVNLAGVLILAGFCVLYTASDSIQFLISSVEDTVKSIALNKDVHNPYENSSVVEAVVPVLIGFALCLFYLYIDEKKKRELNEDKERQDPNDSDVRNPVDNL